MNQPSQDAIVGRLRIQAVREKTHPRKPQQVTKVGEWLGDLLGYPPITPSTRSTLACFELVEMLRAGLSLFLGLRYAPP